ncbi:DNA polymerase phi-domain-containing protein [Gongronella butleri]|nr:DNA polymerase phi-domain-containing protein [Gongronella butleri]
MSTTTLRLYWDLASLDASVRRQATASLIRELATFQQQHEEQVGSGAQSVSTEAQLDSQCATDVAYAVRRLIRGLPSSREGARQGFSLALTELLAVMDMLTTHLVLDLLERHTDRIEASNNEETRDLLFGRLFGLMAIASSGILRRDSTTVDDLLRVFKMLADLAHTKNYLHEVCYHVLAQIVPFVHDVTDDNDKQRVLDNVKELFLEKEIHNVDQVHLALVLQKQFPALDLTEAFEGWASNNVFDEANLARLASIEMQSDERDQQTEWTPALHYIWDLLLDAVLGDESRHFSAFWSTVVDNNLFNMQASHGRRFWGFQVFNKLLPRLSDQQIPMVFTENFMRALVNNLSSNVRLLNKAARQTALVIEKVAVSNKQVGFALVSQLIGKHGQLRFDTVTRTKTVENILASMDNAGIQSYLSFLASLFVTQAIEGDDAGRQLRLQREWALQQMITLISNTKMPKDEAWIKQVIRFVLVHVLFDVQAVQPRKKAKKAVDNHDPLTQFSPLVLPDTTRDMCKAKLEALVLALSKLPPLDKMELKTSRWNGTTMDGTLWARIVFDTYQQLAADDKHFSLIANENDDNDDSEYAKQQARAIKVAADTHEKQAGFEILLYHILLRGLLDKQEASTLLTDVLNCYDKLNAEKKKKKAKKTANGTAADDQEPVPIEVIVDIVLSFLTSESPILKGIAVHVFELFSPMMTKQALQNMINIITTNENQEGGDELFGDDEEDETETGAEGDNDDDDELGSDVEMLNVDDMSDVELIDSCDSDNEEVDDELRLHLEQAMREQGVLAGDDSDDEELLGDDAMEAFDDKLAEIFRERKKVKQDPKSMQQSIVHFKNNVMELLGAFAKKNATSPLLLDTIVPLLEVVQATKSKATTTQFVNKVMAYLQQRLGHASEVPSEGYDEKDLMAIVTSVHRFAQTTNGGRTHYAMANQLLVFLRKCIVASGADVVLDTLEKPRKLLMKQYIDAYRISLVQFLTQRSCNLNKQFFGIFQTTPILAFDLSDTLIEHIPLTKCANAYRNTTSLQWLGHLIQRAAAAKDTAAPVQKAFAAKVPALVKAIHDAVTAILDGPRKDPLALAALMKLILQVHNTLPRLDKKSNVWDTSLFTRLSQDEALNAKGVVKQVCRAILV